MGMMKKNPRRKPLRGSYVLILTVSKGVNTRLMKMVTLPDGLENVKGATEEVRSNFLCTWYSSAYAKKTEGSGGNTGSDWFNAAAAEDAR